MKSDWKNVGEGKGGTLESLGRQLTGGGWVWWSSPVF